MNAAQAVQAAIESFCDELVDRAHEHVEGILTGDKDELGKSVIRQDPEQFVCQYLVWPICRAMEYDHVTERYLEGYDGAADFYVRSTSTPVMGEVKRVNHYKRAIRDLRDYLNHRTAETRYGMATDGFSWIFFRAPMDRRKNPIVLEHASLREAAFDYLAEIGAVKPQIEGTPVTRHSTIEPVADVSYQEYGQLRRRPRSEVASTFVERFNRHNLTGQWSDSPHDGTLSQFDSSSLDQTTRTTFDDYTSASSEPTGNEQEEKEDR